MKEREECFDAVAVKCAIKSVETQQHGGADKTCEFSRSLRIISGQHALES